MQEVTDPALLAQLNGNSPTSANSSQVGNSQSQSLGKEVTDPAILAQLNQPIVSPQSSSANSLSKVIGENPSNMDAAKVFGERALYGAGKAIQDVGQLGKTIVGQTVGRVVPDSVNQTVDKGYNAINDILDTSTKSLYDKTMDEANAHPQAAALGQTAGYMGTQLAALSGPTSLAAKGLTKLMPSMIAASPTISGAVAQGTLGAGIGAASDPSNPVQGAIKGGLAGAALGGIAGAISEPINVAGKVIHDTTEDLVTTGQDPTSLTSLRKIQENLKNEGKDYRIEQIQQSVRKEINDQIASIRPSNFVPGQSPIKIIADKLTEQYPKVIAQNEANYDPINTNTQIFQPKNYQDMLSKVQDNLPKVGLPTTPKRTTITNPDTNVSSTKVSQISALPENPTINDMLSYRKQLDGTIKQAQAQAANGKISNAKVLPYYQLRQALNQDIHEAASTIPHTNPDNPNVKTLNDQLGIAEQFNNAYVQPFKTVTKTGQEIDDPQAQNKVWNSISSQLQARRPNFEKIRQNAAMLGPEGKELAGWGLIENSINKATSLAGEYKPAMTNSMLTRMNSTGLLQEVLTPEQMQVAKGISNITYAATRATAPNAQQGFIASKLNFLTKSRAGISVLKVIGNPNTPTQKAQSLIKNILTSQFATQTNNNGSNQ